MGGRPRGIFEIIQNEHIFLKFLFFKYKKEKSAGQRFLSHGPRAHCFTLGFFFYYMGIAGAHTFQMFSSEPRTAGEQDSISFPWLRLIPVIHSFTWLRLS